MTAENTTRWYIDTHAPGAAVLQTAFSWFRERIAASPDRRGLLAVPGKVNLDHIQTVLGSATVKKLKQDNRARLQDDTIELMTEKINPYFWSGPVLALYAPPKLLDMVDSLQTPTEILVVPWLRKEGTQWAQTWGARELGSVAEPPAKRFSNPTVRAALENLTNRVNLSTGIVHQSDRAAAITLFRLLRNAGEQCDPDEVRAWLVSELGWQPQHAKEVEDVATKILAGRRLRASASGDWAPGIVERWREGGSRDPGGSS